MRNRPEAFYDPRTDTVVVIAENAHPIEGESHEAYFTLKILREAAGHGGLSRLFHNPEAQPSVFLLKLGCRSFVGGKGRSRPVFGKWSKIFEARRLVTHSFLFCQNRQIQVIVCKTHNCFNSKGKTANWAESGANRCKWNQVAESRSLPFGNPLQNGASDYRENIRLERVFGNHLISERLKDWFPIWIPSPQPRKW